MTELCLASSTRPRRRNLQAALAQYTVSHFRSSSTKSSSWFLSSLIWQRFTNVSCLRTYYGKKRRDSFDPHRVILLGEDIICMVNLLEIPRVIVFFITSLTCFGCFRREVLFCQASMKIKMSPPSVHC